MTSSSLFSITIHPNSSEEKESRSSNNEPSVKLHLHFRKTQDKNTKSSTTATLKATPYDLEAIAQSIQNIARAAAPIGRVMDYLPTELNTMIKEREYWRDEYERQENDLTKVKKKTRIELEPIQSQIKGIEDEIERMRELILKKKELIGQNDDWIKSHMKRICQF